MVKPIPDNVKEVMNGLSSQQQVVLRAYIASLREEIKTYECAGLAAQDENSHAHYHGHQKCDFDHSHGNTSHQEADHHETCSEDHSHDHGHLDGSHLQYQNGDKEEHGHVHGHDHKDPEHASHKDEHHGHLHEHSEKTEEVPAWKKRALEAGLSDPTAAPFGGSWTTEASLSATDDKIEE